MKIVITGSLGHISRPLAVQLLQEGHTLTIISSTIEREKEIDSMGAKSAIGSIEDSGFLATVFAGADIVYCMEPPVNFFNPAIDIFTYYRNIGNSYAQAIQQTGVKKVVHLSSIGGHTRERVGMLSFHNEVEQILQQLPANVAITTMRPVGFYYNLFAFIPMIKQRGFIASNYNATFNEPWVSPIDIAAAVAEEIKNMQPAQRKVRYVASDEVTSSELAKILGTAIGTPELQWKKITDEELATVYTNIGMSPQAVKGLVEMNAGRQDAVLYEDYFRNPPAGLGKIKLKDFAKEFAIAYNRNS
jgi:uncharacterized protein YbjT (DUF2867 family)